VTDPVFARDPATAHYYERRAREYDDWYTGRGLFAERDRPGWEDELAALIGVVAGLPAARTLDVACGSGYLTRHLRGFVVAVDRSPAMLSVARPNLATGAAVVVADALRLPFATAAFDRVLTGHFYGHLGDGERAEFLAEARRVAPELVVVDSAVRPGIAHEQWQERVLSDGSRHRVYKRYLGREQLAEEIGGEVLLAGTWFVAARSR
jgi:ubiquinone/menaquinone biosynthesis C-methylase UbiE